MSRLICDRSSQEAKAHSPGGSSVVSQTAKAMWSDIQVLPVGRQIFDSDLSLPSHAFNDPEVTSIRPFMEVSRPLDLAESFRLWRKTVRQALLTNTKAGTTPKPTIEIKAAPALTKAVQKPAITLPEPSSPQAKRPDVSKRAESAAGSMRAALGASLGVSKTAQDENKPNASSSRPSTTESPPSPTPPKSPVPRLGLENIKKQESEASSSIKAQPQAQGFFGGMNLQDTLSGALGGLTGASQAQAPQGSGEERTPSSSWLTGFMATPKSAAQTEQDKVAKQEKTAPAAASAPPVKVKNELVPSPRKLELTPAQKAAADAQIAAAAPAQKPAQSSRGATVAAIAAKPASKPPMVPAKSAPAAAGSAASAGGESFQPIESNVGVGMRIQDDAPHKVIALVPGGPAARCGAIRVGDHLVAISDVEVETLTPAEIRSQIIGPDGSSVTLRLRRPASGAGSVLLKMPSERANVKSGGGSLSRGGSAASSAAGTPVGTPREEYSVTIVREPAMKGALKAAAIQNKSVKELHLIFKKFDLDGSGRIDRGEMRKVLASLGFAATEVEVQRMINQSSPRATVDFPTFLTILGVNPTRA